MDDSTSSDEFIENAELGHNNENGACNHEEEEKAAIGALEPSVGWIFPKAKVSYVHARHLFILQMFCSSFSVYNVEQLASWNPENEKQVSKSQR